MSGDGGPTVTECQFASSALRYIRGKTEALRDDNNLQILENRMAQATTDLEFYAALRSYSIAALARLRI